MNVALGAEAVSIELCVSTVMSLLVIREVVTGAAFFPRGESLVDRGLRGFSGELFVYREENRIAFWVLIAIHSAVVSFFWFIAWWH